MKLREIVIIETGAASDFLRLAGHVQGKLNRNRIIMNNDIWKGSIIKADLDNGLSMYCWNCRLSEPVALYHTMIPGNHIRCSLAYNLAPVLLSPGVLRQTPGPIHFLVIIHRERYLTLYHVKRSSLFIFL